MVVKEVKDIYKRLDEIITKIVDPKFRENKGLGNEIGFYVFDYNSNEEFLIRDRVRFINIP